MTSSDDREEKAYLRILQNLDAIVWKADATTLRFSFVSPRAVDILGYPVEDWIQDTDFFEQHIDPADRERTLALLHAVVCDGKTHRVLCRMIAADGRRVWLRTELHPICDPAGRPVELLGLSLEMNERIQALERLQESEARQKLLMEQIPVVLWTTDKEARFTTSAGAGLKQLGLHPDLVAGASFYEYFQTEDPDDPNIAPTLKALAGEPVTYDTTWSDRCFQVHVEPFRDSNGVLLGTIGVGLDITERKRAEDALRENEARLRLLLEQLPAILWTTDRSLRFTSSQGTGLANLGLRPNTNVETTLYDFFETRDPTHEAIAAHLRALAGHTVVYESKFGSRHYQSRVEPLRDARGLVGGVIGVSIDITRSKRAEESLKESEERLRTLIEASPDPITFKDARGAWLVVNRAGLELFGLEGIDYRGKSDVELAEAAPAYRKALYYCARSDEEAWEGRALSRSEEVIPKPQGAARTFDVIKVPLYAEDGGRKGLIVLGRDITDRKRVEEALRESEKQYRDLVNTIDGIVWQSEGTSFRFSFVSSQAERIMGYPISTWLDEPDFWESHIHPDDRERAVSYCMSAILEHKSHELEYRMIAADGHEVWLRDIVTVIAEEGQPVVSRGVMVDITALKRAQEERDLLLMQEKKARLAAEEAERRATFLAEASRVLSASLDDKGTLVKVARMSVPYLADWCSVCMTTEAGEITLVALAHVDPEKENLASSLSECVIETDAQEGIPHVIRMGAPLLHTAQEDQASLIATLGISDSESRTIIRELGLAGYMVVPLIARGRTLGAMLFATSSASRRFGHADLALAEELARRAAMAVDNARLYQEAQDAIVARDEFLSIASHELRTPCTSLMLGVQSLLRYAKNGSIQRAPPAFVNRVLETADRQSRKLALLIDRLLDVSRIRAGKLQLEVEDVDLAALLSEVAAGLREELARSGSELVLHVSRSVVGRWDKPRLEQVITNLLSNAIKYGQGKPIEISLFSQASKAFMVIRDFGIGIDAEHQGQIFERFERAVSSKHYGGLGLGLYIVREIVEAHGGTIRVESAPGKGATFTVELPLPEPVTTQPARESAALEGSVHK